MHSRKNQISGSEDVLVLHGDDKLAIRETVAQLIGEESGFSELNTSKLDGNEANQSDVVLHLNMLPMGSDKRKVIVENGQEVLKNKSDQKWIQDLFEKFPPSAQLIMILNDEKKYRSGSLDWLNYPKSHWLRNLIESSTDRSFWGEYLLPDLKGMPKWIQDKANELGGDFHPSAAHALANLVGDDLYQATNEIEKAIAYAGEQNQVSAEDVRLLCAASKEENIFALVDAVGMRDGKTATRLFREMSTDMPAPYIFSMLVRQIRLLLQTKIAQGAKGTSKDVIDACELKWSWQADKLINQARRFSTKELSSIYKKLDHIDEDSKTGRITLEPAIETLIISIARKPKKN